jgi:hypothetical protein
MSFCQTDILVHVHGMPYMQVEVFVEMFEMEIVQQMGDEWYTTGPMPLGWSMCDMWFSLWRTKQLVTAATGLESTLQTTATTGSGAQNMPSVSSVPMFPIPELDTSMSSATKAPTLSGTTRDDVGFFSTIFITKGEYDDRIDNDNVIWSGQRCKRAREDYKCCIGTHVFLENIRKRAFDISEKSSLNPSYQTQIV